MITSKEDLRECLKIEKKYYIPEGRPSLRRLVGHDAALSLYKFTESLRKAEYHHNSRGVLNKILFHFYRRRKNILGIKLGIEIPENVFDTGLFINHAGCIVVNRDARIGKNCKLAGDNCIGVNWKTWDCPVIGDKVRIGVGAKVIGG